MAEPSAPIVTVIIPTFGRLGGLRRAVESVLAQTSPAPSIIVIDDNDPESAARKEARHVLGDLIQSGHVKLLEHSANLGGSEARNTGLRQVTTPYVSFLDDDDEFFADKLEVELEALEKSSVPSAPAFVMSEMEIQYPDGKRKKTDRHELFSNGRPQLENHLLRVTGFGFVGTPSFLFRTSALMAVGGFPRVKIRQEYALMLAILASGATGIYLGRPTVVVHVSAAGITRKYSKAKLKELKNIYRLQLNHSDALSSGSQLKMYCNYWIDLAKYFTISGAISSPAAWLDLVQR